MNYKNYTKEQLRSMCNVVFTSDEVIHEMPACLYDPEHDELHERHGYGYDYPDGLYYDVKKNKFVLVVSNPEILGSKDYNFDFVWNQEAAQLRFDYIIQKFNTTKIEAIRSKHDEAIAFVRKTASDLAIRAIELNKLPEFKENPLKIIYTYGLASPLEDCDKLKDQIATLSIEAADAKAAYRSAQSLADQHKAKIESLEKQAYAHHTSHVLLEQHAFELSERLGSANHYVRVLAFLVAMAVIISAISYFYA